MWGIKVKLKDEKIFNYLGFTYYNSQQNYYSFGFKEEEACIFLTVEEALQALALRDEYFKRVYPFNQIEFLKAE